MDLRSSYGAGGETYRRSPRKNHPVHFVPGGTAANTAISFRLLPSVEAVSAIPGHIVGDEVGAVESGGHKIITVPTESGKFDPEVLNDHLESFGSFHNVLPGMIYLSNATENRRLTRNANWPPFGKWPIATELFVYIDGAPHGERPYERSERPDPWPIIPNLPIFSPLAARKTAPYSAKPSCFQTLTRRRVYLLLTKNSSPSFSPRVFSRCAI